jgi:hypothetical protein
MWGVMNLILVAERIPRLGTDLCNAIQIGVDVRSPFLRFDIGDEVLETERVYRWKPRLAMSIYGELALASADHSTQHPSPG